MTSEVLILNKRAIVLAADSAVTVSGGGQPRYSKSANKIFEIASNGAVAAAIYGSDQLDSVPWELIMKLFRQSLAGNTFATLSEYSEALVKFLTGNAQLFPLKIRLGWIESQFDDALKNVLEAVKQNDPSIFDDSIPLPDRQARWKFEATKIRGWAAAAGIASSLSQGALDELINDIGPWENRAKSQVALVPAFAGVDPLELAQLGHIARYWLPSMFLANTGVVLAGYGDAQIFPAYDQLEIFGHIGHELHVKTVTTHQVTHADGAKIQPLAQRSMIDMFTEGFGASLAEIIDLQGKTALQNAFVALDNAGIVIPPALADSISQDCNKEFTSEWRRKNWNQNYYPLMAVLHNLSAQEMAHLAESLLGLQSLKERVTSPSESVGGPIDVAVITKGEGLVWIKRKHYFDIDLNMRYAARLERSLK